MKVILFQPRFASLVESGQKQQTIRPRRKIPIHVGDVLSLREWAGKPYRSKQRILAETTCTEVHSITLFGEYKNRIDWLCISIDGKDDRRNASEINAIAKADGFEHPLEMFEWFRKTHGLPFSGQLIMW